ncbi:phage Tail Collar [Candidatus Koribacter versatilis Ellin345]|uniref:Phage Tail Collar n=1 Tax=Koribacter versatilis (strain Ellin345) TaxID=204669 RepID=Q1INU4_KORVE|nr:tail fiber protein [Candidatus Koribacter versatilis]ABF41456.1 phage Tail Collar [Candidatus Koribacter versatilis Ellin345]
MSDQFVAEIRIFSCNFAPSGWAMCNGQLLPISQNTALFSLVGTFYGGNGTNNFGLPNLQARAPMNQGSGPGLTPRSVGETGGETQVSLLQSEIPAHSHLVNAVAGGGDQTNTSGHNFASDGATRGKKIYATTVVNGAFMATKLLNPSGGTQPHNNLPPYLTLTFCIALQGIFPARN